MAMSHSGHLPMNLNWKDVETALLNRTATDSATTLQQWLQNMVEKGLFPSIGQTPQERLGMLTADLRPLMRSAGTLHIRNLVGGICRISCYAKKFRDTVERLVDTLTRLASLHDNSGTALTLFQHAFQGLMPMLWRTEMVLEYKLMLGFDEVLLALFKKVPTEHAISSLQKWRKTILQASLADRGEPYRRAPTEYTMEPFLSRSIDYLVERVAKPVRLMLVHKVVGHVLPQELVNMIYDHLLQVQNIPKTHEDDSTWVPLEDPAAAFLGYQGPTTRQCCDFGLMSSARHESFWSTSQRRYVCFHVTDSCCMDLSDATFGGGPAANVCCLVAVRCRGALGGGLAVKGVLTKNGPMVEDRSYLFEANHGIPSRWRILGSDGKNEGKENEDVDGEVEERD